MTLLHVTDLHFQKRWFRWLSEHSPSHDLLVISGDLLDLSHPTYPSEQIRWIACWMRSHPRPILVASSRHDVDWNAHDRRWARVDWQGAAGTEHLLVDLGHAQLGDAAVAAVVSDPPDDYADIWAMHAPPALLPVSRDTCGHDYGDPDSPVWAAAERPRLVLCGSIHRPAAWQCSRGGVQFVNPGSNPSARFPNHVIVDLEQRSLVHVADGTGGPRCSTAALAPLARTEELPVLNS